MSGESKATSELQAAACPMSCRPAGNPGRSALLQLPRPLILGEEPLLLLLDNADTLPEALLSRLETLLTTEERLRLRQRRHPAERSRQAAGLALVRLVLATLLGWPAEALPIERGRQGKPLLAPGPWSPLQFNLSHSGSLLLLGLHRQRPIGVDLERHRPGLRWRAIARRYLEAEVVATLESTPETEQIPAFTAAWCRLEATVKADGRGLAARAESRSDRPGGEPLQLFQPRLPAGYSGAVVLAASPSPGTTEGRACASTASGGIHIASP